MARNRRNNRKTETEERKPPARFVRRRRSRRTQEAGEESQLDASGSGDAIPAAGKGAPRATQRAWGKAPRPAEPPPRNPTVFSYTHTIRKTS